MIKLLLKSIFFISILLPSIILANDSQQIETVLQQLHKKYNIEFSYTTGPKKSWNALHYQFASKKDYPSLLKYLKLFQKEFNKYPVKFIHNIKLKGVIFVKDLSISGQRRAAVPDYYVEYLYYDFERGAHNAIYQQHVIHHELYHMVEQEKNGSGYYKDPNWAKLNSPDFQYGKGGRFMRGGNAYTYNHPQPGFVNLYSTSGLEEDKAEIFATLFIPSEYKMAEKWIAEGDNRLATKINYMKQFLQTIDPSMNEQYWREFQR